MLQGYVAGLCSRDQIAELAHLWKSCRDVFQGHVAATHPHIRRTLSLAQHEICAKFAPATCPMKSEKVPAHMRMCNMSLKDVPATFSQVCELCDLVPATCPCYMSLLHSPATCPVSVYLTRFCFEILVAGTTWLVPATSPTNRPFSKMALAERGLETGGMKCSIWRKAQREMCRGMETSRELF